MGKIKDMELAEKLQEDCHAFVDAIMEKPLQPKFRLNFRSLFTLFNLALCK